MLNVCVLNIRKHSIWFDKQQVPYLYSENNFDGCPHLESVYYLIPKYWLKFWIMNLWVLVSDWMVIFICSQPKLLKLLIVLRGFAAGWHCLVLWFEGSFGSETLEKHDWLPDYKRVTNSILIKAEWILNEPIMLCLTHSLMNYDFCSFLSGTKPDSKKLIVTMTAIFVFMMIVIALVVFVYVKNR